MKEVNGVVENGRVKLPPSVRLPDGTVVRVIWDEPDQTAVLPYEREALTAEDVASDVRWANGRRFQK